MSSESLLNQPAPDFVAPVVTPAQPDIEAQISSEDLRDSWVLLYFYPKDDTPGCTTQACDIRDQWSSLPDDLSVFGVSADSVAKHRKFIEKYTLPFPLITDEDKSIVEAYGVWVEKKLYGKIYMGIERTSFLIDPDGIVRAVFPKVKPADHLAAVLDSFKTLTAEK